MTLGLQTTAPNARADDVYTIVIKKQEEKKKSRWTLAEWLETRDRMRLMDLWLALNSPSPYEFFFGGDLHFAEESPGASYRSGRIDAAAFASIFGLGFQWESSPVSRWIGTFNLRVFGFHDQSTNITLHAGVRSTLGNNVRNAIAGASLSIYLTRYFGIDGLFRHFFPSATGPLSNGNRYQGGAFIDFSFLRIYGAYFSESETSALTRKGVNLGARVYF